VSSAAYALHAYGQGSLDVALPRSRSWLVPTTAELQIYGFHAGSLSWSQQQPSRSQVGSRHALDLQSLLRVLQFSSVRSARSQRRACCTQLDFGAGHALNALRPQATVPVSESMRPRARLRCARDTRRTSPRSQTARAARAVRQRRERQERRTTGISAYQFVSLLATPAFFRS
jgi:hypothetical protein